MRKLLFTVLIPLLVVTGAQASSNISNDFRDHYSVGANLSAYNRDINALIGMADFHTGKATTFPGFDIGGTASAVKVGKDNDISSEDFLFTGFVTAETFIPVANITLALRGTDLNGFESFGGGIKYGYNVLEVVHLSLSGFYDRAKTDYYTTDHYSVSAVASTSLLVFTPYVGLGYDYGDLSVRRIGNRSTSDGAMRYTAGVNVHPFPFVYVYGSYTYTTHNHGFQGGLGLNF